MGSRLLLVFLLLGASALVLSEEPATEAVDVPQEESLTGPETLVIAEDRDSIVYSAESIRYLVDERKVLLFGNARASYGDVSVLAETLIFDSREKVIIAIGNPVLQDGDQTIYGDSMGYRIETGYGEISGGRTKIEKGWFEGRKTRKVGQKTLEVEGGTFTTCDRIPPHYYFAANRMKIYQDDMVICEPVVMYVGEVPIFFMPYWFFPIKKGRQSGFLLPKVGTDRSDGRYVKELAYFMVLNDYSDLLLSADYLENRGLRSSLEAVYIVRPYLEGRLLGSYIDEMYTNRKRWRLEANHTENLGHRMNLRARADFQSDMDYEVDYNENRIVQLNRRLESYVSLSKTWSGASANIVMSRTENLDQDQIVETLPKAVLNLSDRRLFEPSKEEDARWFNRLRTSFSGVGVNWRQRAAGQESKNTAAEGRLNVSVPLAVLRHVNINPSTSFRETVYGRDSTSAHTTRVSHYTSSVGANTTIYGVSAFGAGPVKAFRHVLKPSLSYSYAPEPEGTYYSVPGIGGASAANYLGASIGNDIQAKPKREGAPVLTLASVDISASYDFRKSDRKLSDIRTSARINPLRVLDLDVRMSHDPHERFKLTSLSLTTTLRLAGSSSSSKGWSTTIEGAYARNVADRSKDTYQVWGNINLWPTDRWQLTYSQRYDVKEREQIEQKVVLVRDLHAWEGRFEWETFGGEWRYDLRLSIRAIPEIKLGKGVFGVFLP
jgi:lipopolysaccharide assembly outer membrane protein LptD (OstA)